MESFITSNQYLRELAHYELNKLWIPSLGHFAVKTNKGIYSTPVSEIISLNKTDLVFINISRLKEEYFWIPTYQDLIELAYRLHFEKEYSTFQKFYANSIKFLNTVLEQGKETLELCLLNYLYESGFIDKENSLTGSVVDFNLTKLDADIDTAEHKEKFLKEYV